MTRRRFLERFAGTAAVAAAAPTLFLRAASPAVTAPLSYPARAFTPLRAGHDVMGVRWLTDYVPDPNISLVKMDVLYGWRMDGAGEMAVAA